jgi:hypothetical protein
MGVEFTIATGLRQRIHSRVRVTWDSRQCFTLWFETSLFVASYDSHGYGGIRPPKLFLSELSLMLRPAVSRPVCLGIKNPSGAYDQIFITVNQLRVYCCGELSRGRVCRLQLLLALASAVIFESESRGTRDHILLFQIRDFPFRRLLRLAGLRWRYSTPPSICVCISLRQSFADWIGDTLSKGSVYPL